MAGIERRLRELERNTPKEEDYECDLSGLTDEELDLVEIAMSGPQPVDVQSLSWETQRAIAKIQIVPKR